ncbi:hypothetical protein V6N13_125219 [Hibiscus sabdariffa]
MAIGSFRGRNEVINMFVNNIPEKLHGKSLWHAFGRHVDVVDAFIANKKNKEGKRFSFVRVFYRIDANRAMESLNNFRLFGNKISVSIGRFKSRQSFWRKVNKNQNNKVDDSKAKTVNVGSTTCEEDEQGEPSRRLGEKKKKLESVVMLNQRSYRNSKNALYGRCLLFVQWSVFEGGFTSGGWGWVRLRLKDWGCKTSILSSEDVELFKMLEDLNWSYLKEIFSDIQMWSETLSLVKEAMRLEVT